MTRADVLAYAQTLEFVPPCLHWGTCQACGVTVWWATWPVSAQPRAFMHHACVDGLRGRVVYSGECQLTEGERAGKAVCCPTEEDIAEFGQRWIVDDGVHRPYAATVEVDGAGDFLVGGVAWTPVDMVATAWLGPAEPYAPAALSEAMRRDREP